MSDKGLDIVKLQKYSMYGEPKEGETYGAPAFLISVLGESMFGATVFLNSYGKNEGDKISFAFYTKQLNDIKDTVVSKLRDNKGKSWKIEISHTKYAFEDGKVNKNKATVGKLYIGKTKDDICYICLSAVGMPEIGFKFEIIRNNSYSINDKELSNSDVSIDICDSWLTRCLASINNVQDGIALRNVYTTGGTQPVVNSSISKKGQQYDDDIPF
jgi:hypothetical protein